MSFGLQEFEGESNWSRGGVRVERIEGGTQGAQREDVSEERVETRVEPSMSREK